MSTNWTGIGIAAFFGAIALKILGISPGKAAIAPGTPGYVVTDPNAWTDGSGKLPTGSGGTYTPPKLGPGDVAGGVTRPGVPSDWSQGKTPTIPGTIPGTPPPASDWTQAPTPPYVPSQPGDWKDAFTPLPNILPDGGTWDNADSSKLSLKRSTIVQSPYVTKSGQTVTPFNKVALGAAQQEYQTQVYISNVDRARVNLEAQAGITQNQWLDMGATPETVGAIQARAAAELSNFNRIHEQEKVAAQLTGIPLEQLQSLNPMIYDELVKLPLGLVVPDPTTGGYKAVQ